MKFVFGAEAYWVKDRHEKDRTNCHIVLLAKNEFGRQEINGILSEASKTGYYYKPRIDVELLLSLDPKSVMVTSACVAGWHYEDADEIFLRLHDHFKDNFFFEIQGHNTDKQKELNQKIYDLSKEHGVNMIVGLDSHFIYPEQASERDYLLASRGLHYDEEDDWDMDYPDEKTVFDRFMRQGVFDQATVQKAMDNTDLLLDFEDYDILPDGSPNPIFSTEVKLPTLFDGEHIIDGQKLPKLSQKQKDSALNKIVSREYKKWVKDYSLEEKKQYFDGIKDEMQTIKDTKMADYFLIDYYIVKKALENGAVLTNTGRGSAVSFMVNTLLGFSKVDRFKSPIKLYPERFMSTSRILESASLPDIDLNWGTVEIAEEAQKEIMGEKHVYPMIAFGTAKKKSAFKMYARAQKMDFDLANAISKQIEKYDEAVKYADDDEKDEINIYDYVHEQYHSYIDASKKYWGIITDKKKAPCSYLLYNGDIEREIGLIKCKSESTKKEYITTVIDGAIAEKYKFLKNDLLKVDSALLIDKVYKRIGQKPDTVNKLVEKTKDDPKVWAIYGRGLTVGVNQCEKPSTTKKATRYKPSNISELSAFIAAIRPGFKSMYKHFENRETFEYDIPALDNILQTKEMPVSFMIFQEQVMNVLNYAGFPIDQCYSIIKAIAKKHPEKVVPLKAQFLEGFSKQLQNDDNMNKDSADEASDKVWQIIADNCNYSFNSSHAYSMALDSLYQAYQKANYPYEFYEVLLQHYSDKGQKDKVADLKKEMKIGFKIREGEYRFGLDNRKFKADEEHHAILPSLLSIKGLSQTVANDLFSLSKHHYDNFYELWKAMKKKKSLNSAKVNILVEIDYFKDFGSIKKIKNFISATDVLYEKSQFTKAKLPDNYAGLIIKHCKSETEKLYREFDFDSALNELWELLEDEETSLHEQLNYELKYFGYIKTINPEFNVDYFFVQSYECKFKNPKLGLYRICDGKMQEVKVRRAKYDLNPIEVGDIICAADMNKEGKWFKDEHGEWQQDKSDKEIILKKWNMVI